MTLLIFMAAFSGAWFVLAATLFCLVATRTEPDVSAIYFGTLVPAIFLASVTTMLVV